LKEEHGSDWSEADRFNLKSGGESGDFDEADFLTLDEVFAFSLSSGMEASVGSGLPDCSWSKHTKNGKSIPK
jgi:hypothetical protein